MQPVSSQDQGFLNIKNRLKNKNLLFAQGQNQSNRLTNSQHQSDYLHSSTFKDEFDKVRVSAPPKVGPKLNWESSRLTEGDEKPETNQNYFTYNPMRKRQSMKKMFKFDTSIDELSD